MGFEIVDFTPPNLNNCLPKLCHGSDLKRLYQSWISPSIIIHARNVVLFSNGTLWLKRTNTSLFDTRIGNYHGPKVCELVNLYIVNGLRRHYHHAADCTEKTVS